MKRFALFFGSLCLLLLFFAGVRNDTPFYIPTKWPKPSYDFSYNPLSEEKFELGRTLFYDPDLSRDSTISCANCHLQYSGFTHIDHALSHGIDGQIGTRNAPVLINLAWQNSFHWDGGVSSLNKQAINPLTHPKEMDNTLEEILRRLNASTFYRSRFYAAFGDSAIEASHLLKALANFTVSLVSAQSKYDHVKNGESSFSPQEKSGYQLFKKYCASCHQEPLFTKNEFKSNGLPYSTALKDVGRMGITHRASDSLLFKIPTLRNIEFSFPYMHDGRFKSLKEVLSHYAELHSHQTYYSKELKKLNRTLSAHEQKDLLAFLKTLSDPTFLFNPAFKFPKNERSASNDKN
ncbi:MAG: cytochrome-c peroxidase [Flavobacteriales bacterium]